MSRRVVWIVVVVTIVVLGVGGGFVAGLAVGDGDGEGQANPPEPAPSSEPSEESPAGPVGPVPQGLAEFYGQALDWQACGDNECATMTVPLDYTEAGAATTGIALERTLAADADRRVGSLVVNPGGPGAPGTTMAENAADYFNPALLDRVDVVAFDPRGTGDSDPVDCLSDADLDAYVAQDPTPDDAAETRQYVQDQRDFLAGCVQGSAEIAGHVSTVETARDLDVLRSVLGEERLSYLGFSYGTTLGSTYASLFPATVGRFVLDGATDPTLDGRANALSQARGFQTALDAYLDDCVGDDGDCFLGGSREEALATIDELFATIEAQPLPTGGDRELAIGNAFYGVALPLYSRANWPALDQGLAQALDGNGETLMLLSDVYGSRNPDGSYADNSLEAFGAINCLDDPGGLTPDRVPAEYPAFDEASPTFGRVFAWGLIGCVGAQVTAAEEPPTIRAEGAAPIVVVGTTRDPATPYEEAVALADQLASGVLLSRDGDGHTAYNSGNDCIDEAIEGYLLDGEVPADGTEC